jgi:hypothetical protein
MSVIDRAMIPDTVAVGTPEWVCKGCAESVWKAAATNECDVAVACPIRDILHGLNETVRVRIAVVGLDACMNDDQAGVC